MMNSNVRDNAAALFNATRQTIVVTSSSIGFTGGGSWQVMRWSAAYVNDWSGFASPYSDSILLAGAATYAVTVNVFPSGQSGSASGGVRVNRYSSGGVLQEEVCRQEADGLNRGLSVATILSSSSGDFIQAHTYASATGTVGSYTGRLTIDQRKPT